MFGEDLFKEEPLLAVDIRVVQRNARKRVTTVSGLPEKLDYDKVIKVLKKSLNCSGTIKEDNGKHIQLSGDQRQAVAEFLIEQKICTSKEIKIHGA